MSTSFSVDWTIVADGGPGAHRLFRHCTTDDGGRGRISLCDQSGTDPDDSDDGPLWIDQGAKLRFSHTTDTENGDVPYYWVKVEDKTGWCGTACVCEEIALWLVTKHEAIVNFGAVESAYLQRVFSR